MFSGVRRRMTYANVVATMAMVFAMSGGAYAASKYLITSTKQIKPSVLASLKGKSGKAGANGVPGTTGPAGPQGPAGAAGAKGETGATGATGPVGPKGATGATGATGPAGQTGFTETLPAGKTETGTWEILEEEMIGTKEVAASFSFPIPVALKERQNGKAVYLKVGESHKEECEGSAESPTAPAGTLCVYAQEEELHGNVFNLRPIIFGGREGFGGPGAVLNITGIGTTEAPMTVSAYGSWAVTAPTAK